MKLVKMQHTNFLKAIQIKNYDTGFSNGLRELHSLQSLTVCKKTQSLSSWQIGEHLWLWRSKLESELKRLVQLVQHPGLVNS